MEQASGGNPNVHRLLSAGDASQILKDMLNVGKSPAANSSGASGAHHGQSQGQTDTQSPVQMSRDDPAVMSTKPSQSTKNLLPDPTKLVDIMGLDAKVKQHIVLEGDDRRSSVPVYGREVDITPSMASCIDSPVPGSNKVKITPVVNYDWEAKYYIGNLVAVNNTFVVYVLKIQSGYGLRILNRRSTVRALLKGFTCIITDIAFAHHNADVLGCIDQRGNLSVWHIVEEGGKISYTPKINVIREQPPSEYHRLVWCPYLPEDVIDEDVTNEWSNLLAVSHEEKAELWDIQTVAADLGTDPIPVDRVKNGLIMISGGHSKAISDMAVSPDGSVLATASFDGYVKFWQMYWELAGSPRCLHQFSPHDGLPVTSLLFCDNHKHQDPNLPFWRFLITGADYNRELKVWCTVQWTCLQCIRFGSPSNGPQPCLKVKLDLSASFLMATDIKRKVLYVVQLFQEHEEGRAHFTSLTEFLLMSSMLSFAIVDAGRCRVKRVQEEVEDGEELQSGEFEEVSEGIDEELDKDDSGPISVLIKMFCVFSRALKELQIRFQPNPSVTQDHLMAGSINSTSQGDATLHDGLSDVSFSATEKSLASTDTDTPRTDHTHGITPRSDPLTPAAESLSSSFTSESTPSTGQPYLMTPEALMNASAKSPSKTTPTSLTRDSASSSISSFTHITGGTSLSVDDLLSSCGTSDMVGTPDSSATLTPTQAPSSNQISPRVAQLGSPLHNQTGSQPFAEIREDEDEEGPKSPPPTPEEAHADTMKSNQVMESSENIAELLQKSARIQEKRMSDSSAEVAQILGGANAEEEIRQDGVNVETPSSPLDIAVEAPGGDNAHMKPDASPAMIEDNKYHEDISTEPVQDSNQHSPGSTEEYNALSARPGKLDNEGDTGVTANGEVKEEGGGSQQVEVEVAPVQHLIDLQDQDVRSDVSSDPDPADGRRKKGGHRHRKNRPEGVDTRRYQQDLTQVVTNLDQILATLQSQQQEMKQLRQDMNKAQLSNSIIQSTKARVDKLERSLGTKMETLFSKQAEQERQRLNTALQEKNNLDKQKQERLLETVTQTLRQQVTSRLDKTVRNEVDSKVVPEVQKLIGPVTDQLNTTIAQKLTATDQLMRENISKLVKSKGIADTIGQAAAHTLSGTIQTTYRDAFHSTVVPAFERACTSMFEQINASFESGTKDYVNQLEATLAKIKQKQREGHDPIVNELRALVETHKANAESLKTSLVQDIQGELSEQLHNTTEQMKKEILDKVQMFVREELSVALQKHHASIQENVMAAVRSQAPTPVPQTQDIQHVQAKIKHLLEQKQINTAFQQALNASDLRVVVFTCQEVTPEVIFTDGGCLLEQPVLLSLIQQLSQDLGKQTKIKCMYIDEALLAVDTTFPVTKEHLPGIIVQLCQQISEVIRANPNHPQVKQLRRVLMQAQSLK